MTVKELYTAMSERIPTSLSAEWDNDGAMCIPAPHTTVTKVLTCLDVTDEVIDRAISADVSVIVSHHPLIFGGVRALNGEDAVSARLLRLVSKGIAVFSFHTRFDAVKGGINDTLAMRLGLSDVCPLGEGEASLGRIGTFPTPLSTEELCRLVKAVTGAPALRVKDAKTSVRRLALVGGEGRDFIESAVRAGADAYLSGRFSYHAMIDSPITLVEAGHYFSERHAADALADAVKTCLPEAQLEIYAPDPLAVY